MEIFEKAVIAMDVLLVGILIYLLFVLLPVTVINEADCLEKGFPVTKTTVYLDGYCLNLDGAVTGKVERIDRLR